LDSTLRAAGDSDSVGLVAARHYLATLSTLAPAR
jgi:hypothetical protein